MVSTGSVRSRLVRLLLGVAGLAGVAAVAAGTAFYIAFVRDLPDIESVEDYQPPLASLVLDRDGRRIGEFFFERRRLVPLTEVPQHVVRAFVAAEDSSFFEHAGIDYPSILRAAWANLRAGGEIVQGASTITQQMVKGLLLSPERKFRRKMKEILLARDIEQRLTKQEILYLYLNQIYFGHGAYGLREAARTYFGKEVGELTVSESAQLAGLPKAPSSYSPHRNPELAEKRRRYVLDRMLEEHYIDSATHDEALADRPPLSEQPWRRSYDDAAYFTEEVRRYLFEELGGDAVLEGGLVIETTLDPHLQAAAVVALRRGLEELDRRQGYRGPERRVESADMETALVQLAKDNGLAGDADSADDAESADEAAPDDAASPDDADSAEDTTVADADAPVRAPALAPADAPLRLRERLAEEPLRGLITRVDREAQRAEVAFAPGAVGVVHLEDVTWAHEADPDRSAQPVKAIDKVFRRGDVARFALRPPDPEPDAAEEPAADPAADPPAADPAELRVTLAQEPLVQGGLLSLDLASGDVLALVGGYDYDESQFDRVTQARRQPGSAFKPIIYGAALAQTDEAGHKRYTPASIIHDRPKVYNDHSTGFIWKPKNYGREFYGPITLRTALAKSINTAAVHLCDEVGIGNVIDYAKRLGIESPMEPSLSLALGTSGVSLLELTRSYAVFPAGGRRVIPHFIRRVTDRDGNVLFENVALGNSFEEPVAPAEPADPDIDVASGPEPVGPPPPAPDPEQVIPAEDAYLMTDLLRAVVLEGTGQSVAKLGRPLAGKTGTTNDQADAWFVGFSPEIVTGVWVGHDEIHFLGAGETGARAAAPVWIDFMSVALADVPKRDFSPPGSIVFARIDRETGLLASHQTKETVFQSFIAGTEPTETAETHRSTSEALRDLREDSLSRDQAVQLMKLEGF